MLVDLLGHLPIAVELGVTELLAFRPAPLLVNVQVCLDILIDTTSDTTSGVCVDTTDGDTAAQSNDCCYDL